MPSLKAWNGQAEVKVTSEATGTSGTFASAELVPAGYRSITDMLSRDRFYIAHRGGSVNYPEMSLYAYTRSVLWGAGALELSLARTSDGVWFGNHDQTLLRTCGVDRDPKTMTWAEVAATPIKGNRTGDLSHPDQPHARFEEIRDAYGSTHVFFLDPKYEQSVRRAEFWALCESFPQARERVVVKYHMSNTSLARDARARGYKTWGYFYSNEIDADAGQLDRITPEWDFLGLDYNGSAANWAAIGSYGKPVIGHVVPTAAGADRAWSLGADGMMSAGVQQIIPKLNGVATLDR